MTIRALVYDFAERAFMLLLATPFMLAIFKSLPSHPLGILIALAEGLVVAFILIRRPGAMATAPYPLAVAFIGTALPLLIRPTDVALAPAVLTAPLMVAGLLVSVAAKLALNRSFGLVAANRGVKQGGPYRLVRHPMYLGYFMTQVGFLLSEFSWQNCAIYLAAWLFQVLRILAEESFLAQDAAYREFMQRVPRRIVPGF